MRIIGGGSKECSVLSPEKLIIERACVLVHNIFNNDVCDVLQSHITTELTSIGKLLYNLAPM